MAKPLFKLYLASLRVAFLIVCVSVFVVSAARAAGFLPEDISGHSQLFVQLIGGVLLSGIVAYALMVARLMGYQRVNEVIANRVRDSLDVLPEGVLLIDEDQRIVVANRSFSQMVSLTQTELIGRKVSSLRWACCLSNQPDDLPWVRAANESKRQYDQLMRYQRGDGSYCVFAINASPIDGAAMSSRGVLATFRDVTLVEEHHAELEQMLMMLRNTRDEIFHKNQELEMLAARDPLTGCLNRRALFERFEELLSNEAAETAAVACLMVDNDHFKLVNDVHGHCVGDEVLRHVAKVLRESFSESAIVCRYGGEEFCIVMPKTKLKDAIAAAESARERIEQIQFTDPAGLKVTVSIGLTHVDFGATEPLALIHQADECLYVAKNRGRNQVVVFGFLESERLQIAAPVVEGYCESDNLPQ